MKNCLIIILIWFPIHMFSQNYFSNIKGTWIVDSIININTTEMTEGKYGVPGEYVKFEFENKSTLFVSNSPIDKGVKVPVSFRKDKIELIPENTIPRSVRELGVNILTPPLLEEPYYKIVKNNNQSFELETVNEKGDKLIYYLSRPIKHDKQIIKIELPEILIKQKINGMKFNVAENNFPMGGYGKLLPEYKDYYSLAWKISHSIDLTTLDLEENVRSTDLKVKLVINSKGKVDDIKIENSINNKLDSTILKLLRGTKWIPIDNMTQCTLILNLNFLLINEN